MFKNPNNLDYNFEEGTVTEIDTVRKLCRLKTTSGRNLNSVRWLSVSGGSSRYGDRFTPRLGDAVIVHNGLGYPIIIGVLPRLQDEDNIFPIQIDTGEHLIDTGSFSLAGNAVNPDQNAAKDMVAGDRLISSEGGGVIGILRGGSILLRSGRLSEVFISKLDDLVRIVSRNWEHFTDLSSDTIKNLKGRVYRYTGYAQTFGDAKKENYKYSQTIGDVALGEKAKADYLNAGSPAMDDRIYKEEIKTGGGGSDKQLMFRQIHLDGKHDLLVKDEADTVYARTTHTNKSTLIKTSSKDESKYTRVYETKDEIIVTYHDDNMLRINKNHCYLTYNHTNTITIDKDNINLSWGGNPVINMNSAGIQATYGIASVIIKDKKVECNVGPRHMWVTVGGVRIA